LWLPFASVRLGMDFARDLCHNPRHHQLAAGPCPAHNKPDNEAVQNIKPTWVQARRAEAR
ncbi:MAG: hypothetical protein LWX01_06090, partial [Deltaproteobacteria bacterium]|nr:hypothetical protein [Deltaproteobacteria bacterium]